MGIIETFDNTTEEILKPSHFAKKADGFPETVIVTLGKNMYELLLRYQLGFNGKKINSIMLWYGQTVYSKMWNIIFRYDRLKI